MPLTNYLKHLVELCEENDFIVYKFKYYRLGIIERLSEHKSRQSTIERVFKLEDK